MPQPCILRLGRRRSAWESADARKIADVEFRAHDRDGLDHAPSVYVIEASASGSLRRRVVQARGEHSVSFTSPPPAQGTLEFDVQGATSVEVRATPGTTRFSFTRESHAELLMRSDDDVISLVQRLLDERTTRQQPVSRDELLSYIDQELRARDVEWESVLGPHGSEQGPWGQALKKWRLRSGSE